MNHKTGNAARTLGGTCEPPERTYEGSAPSLPGQFGIKLRRICVVLEPNRDVPGPTGQVPKVRPHPPTGQGLSMEFYPPPEVSDLQGRMGSWSHGAGAWSRMTASSASRQLIPTAWKSSASSASLMASTAFVYRRHARPMYAADSSSASIRNSRGAEQRGRGGR